MEYFSPSKNGFFNDQLHTGLLPEDSIPLTEDEYATLIRARSHGGVIVVEDGKVVSKAPTPPDEDKLRKAQAKAMLAKTDWTQCTDVQDALSVDSVNDFILYRNKLRQLIINPVPSKFKWPTEPTPVWRNKE